MTLPANPPISMAQVRAEFGAPANTPLHAFVRGGAYVPNIAANSGVPTAAPITLHQLCGASAYQPPVITGPTEVDWFGYASRPVTYFHTTSKQTVSGGNPSKTYSWVRISGSANIYNGSTNTLAGAFYASGGYDPGTGEIPPTSSSATWRLTVRDGTSTVTKDILFHFST